MKEYHVGARVFWYDIFVSKKYGGEGITELHWSKLTYECLNKWFWYFEYRAALLKVKYPKAYIEQRWGSDPITDLSSKDLIWRKHTARRTILRRKITQFRNAILRYEIAERYKLIPDFTNPRYLRTKEKLEEYKHELTVIENKIKEI